MAILARQAQIDGQWHNFIFVADDGNGHPHRIGWVRSDDDGVPGSWDSYSTFLPEKTNKQTDEQETASIGKGKERAEKGGNGRKGKRRVDEGRGG